jgi:hypothetical protein
LRCRLAAIVFAAAAVSTATAADLPLAPAPKSEPAQAPASPLAPPTATCREWSDGCRTCQRAAAGEVSCSNVGIACVPKAAQCSASDTPAR